MQPNLITADALAQMAEAAPSLAVQLIDTLADHPAHWRAVAQAHDAGKIPPLTLADIKRIADTHGADGEKWAAKAKLALASASARHRVFQLVKALQQGDNDGALSRALMGDASVELMPAQGVVPSEWNFSPFVEASEGWTLRSASELGMLLNEFGWALEDDEAKAFLAPVSDDLRAPC